MGAVILKKVGGGGGRGVDTPLQNLNICIKAFISSWGLDANTIEIR